MPKILPLATAMTLALALLPSAHAHYEAGAAWHLLSAGGDAVDDSYENSGLEAYVWWLPSPRWALRSGVYFQHNPNDSAEQTLGVNAAGVIGHGLNRTGWTAYAGPGLYYERWSWSGTLREAESHYGWQLIAGTGYNWQRVALKIQAAYRDTSSFDKEYQKLYKSGDVGAEYNLAASIGLGYRF